MTEQMKRAIREGARKQQGTFDVPSYISIGDPYRDAQPASRGKRWTKLPHSPVATLRSARREDSGPPAPPFMTGAPLTRFENASASARWRKQIENENKKATLLRQQRGSRLPPYALDEPGAYDNTAQQAVAAAPIAQAPTLPEPQSQPQPQPLPQPSAVIPQPGQVGVPFGYVQPPSAPYGYTQPAVMPPHGYMMPPPPPPMIILPAPGPQHSAVPHGAQRVQPRQPSPMYFVMPPSPMPSQQPLFSPYQQPPPAPYASWPPYGMHPMMAYGRPGY